MKLKLIIDRHVFFLGAAGDRTEASKRVRTVSFNVLRVAIIKEVLGGILPHAHLNGKLKNVEI